MFPQVISLSMLARPSSASHVLLLRARRIAQALARSASQSASMSAASSTAARGLSRCTTAIMAAATFRVVCAWGAVQHVRTHVLQPPLRSDAATQGQRKGGLIKLMLLARQPCEVRLWQDERHQGSPSAFNNPAAPQCLCWSRGMCGAMLCANVGALLREGVLGNRRPRKGRGCR